MLLVGRRERELIEQVGAVLLRRFDDLIADWRVSWDAVGSGDPPIDLPAITREAIEQGTESALETQRREAERLVADGVPLERVVSAVLLWEEVILRRLARDAVEDIFSGATALNRFLHHVVLFCAEGYSDTLRAERDDIRRSLEDADRMKSEIISMISHDLKTPLTTIQACAVAMQEAPDIDEPQRQRFLDMTLQNSERLSRLITRIVDVSRIEGRALDLVFQPLDLAEVTARLVEGILPGVRVRVEVPADLPPVRADRDALERILVNLIDNAVRFSPPDAEVVVGAIRVDDEVEVSVSDQGPGIPEGRRTGLFTKFFQVDPSLSGRRSGSGLGLAIVRGLAETMGGSVGYRPNVPEGSSFWFRLPLARPADLGRVG